MGRKVCLRCKGKTLLGDVNKLFFFKSLLKAQPKKQTQTTKKGIFTTISQDCVILVNRLTVNNILQSLPNKHFKVLTLTHISLCLYVLQPLRPFLFLQQIDKQNIRKVFKETSLESTMGLNQVLKEYSYFYELLVSLNHFFNF